MIDFDPAKIKLSFRTAFRHEEMGLKDYLNQRRDKKAARNVEAMTKRLKNQYGQATERKRAIQMLREIDTDDALRGLLTRFTYNNEKSIVDEDEKTTVFEILLARGARVIPLVKEYLHAETAIFWPLKLMRRIEGDEETVTTLLELIDRLPEEYVDTRMMDRRLSLISQLRDYQDERIYERLSAWVENDEEEIRFHAVDAISTYPRPETTALLVGRLLDEEETARIQNFVMDLLIEHRWPVKRQRKQLRTCIPEGFWIDDTGVIQRKN